MSNRLKRAIAAGRALTKDLLVVKIIGEPQAHIWSLKLNREIYASDLVKQHLTHTPFSWNTACIIAARTQQKETYIRIWDVGPPHPATQPQISNSCHDEHLKLIRTINKDHQLNAAWIGSPSGKSLSEEQIDHILTHYGIYEYITPWEYQQLQEKEHAKSC